MFATTPVRRAIMIALAAAALSPALVTGLAGAATQPSNSPLFGYVGTVSCGSRGNCAAILSATYLATERNGRWGRAIEVPGLGARYDAGDEVTINFLTCGIGYCLAGGVVYEPGPSRFVPFILSARNGIWDNAWSAVVRGLGKPGSATITQAACAGKNCLVIGTYMPLTGPQSPFYITVRRGIWSKPRPIPGLVLGSDVVLQVSCGPGGACTLLTGNVPAGSFATTSETAGRWGKSRPIPLPKLTGYRYFFSCGSPGTCGFAVNTDFVAGPMVDIENRGTWRGLTGIKGLPDDASINGLACADASCVIVGDLPNFDESNQWAFVAESRNRAWGKPIRIHQTGRGVVAGGASGDAVSCFSAGDCIAGGSRAERAGAAWLARQRNGAWGPGMAVPGLREIGGGVAFVRTISCTPTGYCTAGGYVDRSGSALGFLVSGQDGRWREARLITPQPA